MSIRKQLNEAFGIEDNVEEERNRFVERVNQSVFHAIDTTRATIFNYELLYEFICYELGVDANNFQRRYKLMRGIERSLPASIKTLTEDDFAQTLFVLSSTYAYIEYSNDKRKGQKWLSGLIKAALSRCTCDIGVGWKAGMFYPSGAEELDKPLIEETMTWLKDYPDEDKNYRIALQRYGVGKPFNGVVENCYTAVEGIARQILGNNKTLDNNKDELLARIDLSNGWNRILANFVTHAHDYRHASEDRHDIKKQEVEAYLYMTGLIIRLIIESNS